MGQRLRFCFSVDVELGAGLDKSRNHSAVDPSTGRKTFPVLLKILRKRKVPSTFAFVGHLLLPSCDGHPLLKLPAEGWLDRDPRSRFPEDDLWYAPDLVEAVITDRTGHELACHSFSHVSFADPMCTVDVARSELEACRQAAELYGVKMHTFVYPFNEVGHECVIAEYGYDHVTCIAPRPEGQEVLPDPWMSKKLIWVPRSYYLQDVTVANLRRLARLVRRAAKRRLFLHVWTHEWSLRTWKEMMLLEMLLRYAARRADILPVGSVAWG